MIDLARPSTNCDIKFSYVKIKRATYRPPNRRTLRSSAIAASEFIDPDDAGLDPRPPPPSSCSSPGALVLEYVARVGEVLPLAGRRFSASLAARLAASSSANGSPAYCLPSCPGDMPP